MTNASKAEVDALRNRIESEEGRRRKADEAIVADLGAKVAALSGRLDAFLTPSVVTPPAELKPDIHYGASTFDFPLPPEKEQPPGSCYLVDAPDGSGDLVWKMPVDNNRKTATSTWSSSDNPRAQLLSPGLTDAQLKAGIWWGGAFYLDPETFPTAFPPRAWCNLAEFYGKPYDGPPTVELDIRGNQVGWQRNSEGGSKDIWRRPYVRGKKTTFLQYITPTSVSMWLSGELVASALPMSTVGAANKDGPQECIIQFYRKFNCIPGTATVYHWPMKIATTREGAEYK